jgi:hypothetical protein
MHIAIIILIVIVLLIILVGINFADSDIPKIARLIVSSTIIIILAAGVYYLAAPASTPTSASSETIPVELSDTSAKISTETSRDTFLREALKEVTSEDTVVYNNVPPLETEPTKTEITQTESTDLKPAETEIAETEPADTERIEAGTSATSTLSTIPTDTLSTLLKATETLTAKKQTINACTAWVLISSKPSKVTYRNCCTNTDTTITITGSIGVCAVYGFTPAGSGVTVISNSSCKCK